MVYETARADLADGGTTIDTVSPLQEPTTVMGLGNNNSGLSFHFHGPGLSEAIVGRKRWFLYPPGMQPHGGYEQLVNTSLSQWIHSEDFGSCESSLLDAIAISSRTPYAA